MGHQPTADMGNWFAPTTAGMSANQRFTLAASTVPVTVKVPRQKEENALLLSGGCAHARSGVGCGNQGTV